MNKSQIEAAKTQEMRSIKAVIVVQDHRTRNDFYPLGETMNKPRTYIHLLSLALFIITIGLTDRAQAQSSPQKNVQEGTYSSQEIIDAGHKFLTE